MKSYAYLHGFASSPASSKGQYFKCAFAEHGISLEIPELDGGDFEHLTLSGQLGVVERSLAGKPCVLLGSSMGGYLAALYAQMHPEVNSLVLLAPAFDLRARWLETMPAKAPRGLLEDAAQYPGYPDCSQRALVLHGRRDDVVPVEYSRTFCDSHPNATLYEFDSGHELTDVLPEMWAIVKPFLNL